MFQWLPLWKEKERNPFIEQPTALFCWSFQPHSFFILFPFRSPFFYSSFFPFHYLSIFPFSFSLTSLFSALPNHHFSTFIHSFFSRPLCVSLSLFWPFQYIFIFFVTFSCFFSCTLKIYKILARSFGTNSVQLKHLHIRHQNIFFTESRDRGQKYATTKRGR